MFKAITVGLALSGILLHADSLVVNLLNQPAIETRLRQGLVPARERQETVARLFAESGCQTTPQPIDKRSANIICTLPGETTETIVVGGHLDFVEEGKGIVDDWSGASLLPSLYQTLKAQHRKHTYQFVAFNGEERGLLGSARYVKELKPEQRAQTAAFINLECLGLTPPKVWVRRSTPLLVDLLADIARAVKIPLQGVNVDKVGDDDTHPFLDKKIPVICIHSVTQETFKILHSKKDDVSAVNAEDYYSAYKLVAFYLAYLDLKMPPKANP